MRRRMKREDVKGKRSMNRCGTGNAEEIGKSKENRLGTKVYYGESKSMEI